MSVWILLWLLATARAQEPGLGARVFARSCAVGYCHGTAGAANRGPRLAGRSFERSYLERVIRKGIPGTAMPGFESSLKPDELTAVIAYVVGLSGGAAAEAAPPPFQPVAVPTFSGPPEAKKGKELFFDATRGVRCGSCHAVEDWGIAVGPNLAAHPPQGASAIRSASTSGVKLAVTDEGERFPGLLAEETKQLVRIYDLTKPPAVLRTFPRGKVKLEGAAGWDHAAVIQSYTDQELESIASYLRWVASRSGTNP